MTADPSSPELSPIKRALLEIRDLRARLAEVEYAQFEPVAIVGLGLRIPGGVDDAGSYWRLLRDGVDAITGIPPTRWSLEQFYDEDVSKPGKMTTRFGAFLDDVDRFDAAFFGISPREATSMDPQQRLLLETTWEAIENAGQSPEKLLGTQTGVFIGISNNDYFRMVIKDLEKIDTYAVTGGMFSVASGRIAYLLGLRGPALSIDTACSSSLVAVHLACQSLRKKETDMALVGGVNLILTPEANINFSKAGMMAADGRCKTFDARADGYVRGEGCVVVVLKRLADAQAARDHILAVIRGSATNQDGRSNGLTAPSGPSQEAVIRSALRSAGVQPHQVNYVETHGTGTSLGDPIEVDALGAVYSQERDPANPLHIGSVKTNVGHLEAAAGLAGLVKVALALHHQEIPPHLHFETPNPHISWADYLLDVPTRRTPWLPLDGRRIGAVSSFGFSGTNAHIILEEAPAPLPAADAEPLPRLVTLSARSAPSLRALAEKFREFLDGPSLSAAQFATLARVSGVGRSHYAHRLALSSASGEHLRDLLAGFLDGKQPAGAWNGQVESSEPPAVAFLFTGHGSHYVNMGRALYDTQPVFREVIDRCDTLLRSRLPRPLLEVLYPDAAPGSAEYQQVVDCLNDMTYGQPAMFALEVALAALWRSWGVIPAAVAGHSLGEYAAAVTAGVVSLEDGLALIAERGRLMQQLPEDGLMVTVFAEEENVVKAIAPYATQVAIAAVNSPETMVISGQREAVMAAVDALSAQGVRTKILNISRAAHSPMVEPMVAGMARAVSGVQFAIPEVEFFSAVSGQVESEAVAQPAYWPRHLRQTVRFGAAVESMYDAGYRVFLEIGPHPTLINLGQRTLVDDPRVVWLPSLSNKVADREQMLESAARLYVAGGSLDWDGLHGAPLMDKIPLPTYPWERKSYWWKTTERPASPVTPRFESASAAAERQSRLAPLDLGLERFSARWDALNTLAAAYMNNALYELGAFQPGETLTPDVLLERYAIKPTYRALMVRWLRHLAGCGWLQSAGEGAYASRTGLQPRPLEALRAAAETAMAGSEVVTEYLVDCGSRLASIITGHESPLEMMFPGGSMQRAEGVYQNWAHARYFNQIVGAAVQAAAHANPGSTLRVLELGAGTGATTASVLPLLPAANTAYYFTDVTDLFLNLAREKFSAYPFVQYGLYDAEKSGFEQGYGRAQFDIVLAANVIHATRSLQDTLRKTQEMLAPGGMLVLFEATTHMPWYDVTTGLIEGWQSFGDDLRADSPLLAPDQWRQVLAESGFEDVSIHPQSGSPAEILGESVILARPARDAVAESAAISLSAASEEHAVEAAPATPADDLLARLREALTDERREILLDVVRGHVMNVLRLSADEAPDRKARLMDIGVDSLMAVELRGRLSLGLKLERKLPATLIFDYPTIEAITDYLLREVLVFAPAADAQPATSSTAIEDLTDEQVEAMLLAKLKKMQ